MEIPHFLMERRMLLGIKQRAEATRARTAVTLSPASRCGPVHPSTLALTVSVRWCPTKRLRHPEPHHQSTRRVADPLAAALARERAACADHLHRPAQRPSLHHPGRLPNERCSDDDHRRLAQPQSVVAKPYGRGRSGRADCSRPPANRSCRRDPCWRSGARSRRGRSLTAAFRPTLSARFSPKAREAATADAVSALPE